MAVPDSPTVADIIINGMREAGQYKITSAQSDYIDFKKYQWATIKAEIWNACRTDSLLESDVMRIAKKGYEGIDLASLTDFDTELNVYVYDMDEMKRGAVQAFSGATITLESSFNMDENELIGAYVFLTDSSINTRGHRTVVAYNNTTKVLTLSSAVSGTSIGDLYYIQGYNYPLRRDDYTRPSRISGRPCSYSRRGTSFFINPHPDKNYVLLFTYRVNLSRMDEDSALFIKHLTERRNLWVQGVKVKTMAWKDDDRYTAEKQIWEQMLAQYAAKNVVYSQIEGSR